MTQRSEHWLVCDIISVISPPGHTSYPKRKLEKLFSPQLGDEEWLGQLLANVTIDSTGLKPVWWSHLAANTLFMCRGILLREMGGNTREKVSSKQFSVCASYISNTSWLSRVMLSINICLLVQDTPLVNGDRGWCPMCGACAMEECGILLWIIWHIWSLGWWISRALHTGLFIL